MPYKDKKMIISYQKEYRKTKIGRARTILHRYNQNDEKYGRGKGDLTDEWIVEHIFSRPCAHCGETDWHKIGCNRLDNSKPHTMDNVEPCCVSCNNKLAGNDKKENGTPVYQYTLDGKFVAKWSSIHECERKGFNRRYISKCCQNIYLGNKNIYKGYIWSYTPL